MKLHRQLILTAAVCVCVLGGQVKIYSQNVTAPREPAPSESDGVKTPSTGTRIWTAVLRAVARAVCEESGGCPRTSDTPAGTESEPRNGLDRQPRINLEPDSRTLPAGPNHASRKFSFFTPSGWQAYDDQSSVTVAPASEYINGNLVNGVILGLADLSNTTFEAGTDRYVRGLLSANKYLRRVGRSESSIVNSVPCITTRLNGLSPQTGYTENVAIYTCQRSAQALFYVVSVNSGPNAGRYEEESSRVIQSISFR